MFSGSSANEATPATLQPAVTYKVPYLKSSNVTSSTPIPRVSDVRPLLCSNIDRLTGYERRSPDLASSVADLYSDKYPSLRSPSNVSTCDEAESPEKSTALMAAATSSGDFFSTVITDVVVVVVVVAEDPPSTSSSFPSSFANFVASSRAFAAAARNFATSSSADDDDIRSNDCVFATLAVILVVVGALAVKANASAVDVGVDDESSVVAVTAKRIVAIENFISFVFVLVCLFVCLCLSNERGCVVFVVVCCFRLFLFLFFMYW
mmetsp:Transcript_29890/g.72443  ORF Transcript_29890/g.72443 Transcript_29890/m.72443 type:complete len:264 (+) Transcript_29890:628-1419(+)